MTTVHVSRAGDYYESFDHRDYPEVIERRMSVLVAPRTVPYGIVVQGPELECHYVVTETGTERAR